MGSVKLFKIDKNIMKTIGDGKLTVNEISDKMEIQKRRASRRLYKLVDEGLIIKTREGNQTFYKNSEKSGLLELTNSKKQVIDLLWKGEKSLVEIKKNMDVGSRRVEQIIGELNEAGALLHHYKGSVRFERVDKTNIKIKHETDKFVPDVILMVGILFMSVVISFYVWFSLKFFIMSLISIIPITILTSYRILKTPSLKHYYIQTNMLVKS